MLLRRSSNLPLLAAVLICATAEPVAAQCTDWGREFVRNDGLDGPVLAIAQFDDGSGPALYVGGYFFNHHGSTSPNTVLLTATSIVNNTLCTFLRGKNQVAQAAVFGDGIKCLNAPMFRFGQQLSGQLGNPTFTVSVGAPTEIPGFTWYYTVQYRNPTPGFCNPGLFNAANGYSISW